MKFKTDMGNKIKVETDTKYIEKQLLEYILIDIIKVLKHPLLEQNIINISMDPIINISFKKSRMTWELIYCRLFHTSDSVMK